MLMGALGLTSAVAVGLRGHAVRQQLPAAADFSPTMDAILDPSGWPRKQKSQALDAPPAEPGRGGT